MNYVWTNIKFSLSSCSAFIDFDSKLSPIWAFSFSSITVNPCHEIYIVFFRAYTVSLFESLLTPGKLLNFFENFPLTSRTCLAAECRFPESQVSRLNEQWEMLSLQLYQQCCLGVQPFSFSGPFLYINRDLISSRWAIIGSFRFSYPRDSFDIGSSQSASLLDLVSDGMDHGHTTSDFPVL